MNNNSLSGSFAPSENEEDDILQTNWGNTEPV
jgi:hypothetical protein